MKGLSGLGEVLCEDHLSVVQEARCPHRSYYLFDFLNPNNTDSGMLGDTDHIAKLRNAMAAHMEVRRTTMWHGSQSLEAVLEGML
jgi:hypothetical protein